MVSMDNRALENEKIQFAANMTHDLLNPLAGIKLAAEVLIKKNQQNSDDERLLKNIVTTTTHLSTFISHILKMSKESAVEEAIYTFSLRQLINDVIETVSLSAEAKELAIFVDLSKDLMITADRYRCFRIVLNLVENAIKYTQKGHVLIRFLCQDNLVTLTIEDTGVGISKEKQEEIFKCYAQLEEGSLPHEGIGLGLHLVLLFSAQMNGKISVNSKKNKGSSFSFSFQSLTNQEDQLQALLY